MKKLTTILLVLLAVVVFSSFQYRIFCLLLIALLWRKSITEKYRKFVFIGIFALLFFSLPNYIQRGRTQLVYFKDKERISTPLPLYLANVIFPEEEIMNLGVKLNALLPDALIKGNRMMYDAKHDFWRGKIYGFYSAYNRVNQCGTYTIAQAINPYLKEKYNAIYVTKPKHYDADKKYPVVFFAHGFMGSWELYQGLFNKLEDCFIVSIGTADISGFFTIKDIQKCFTTYIPYLKSEGYNIDEKQLHMIGLSNGGGASDTALWFFDDKFKTVTYISTDCHAIGKTSAKVLLIGGGKDGSSSGLPSAKSKFTSCGTEAKILWSDEANHFMLVYEIDKIIDFLKKNYN